jgi:hypothetical protein
MNFLMMSGVLTPMRSANSLTVSPSCIFRDFFLGAVPVGCGFAAAWTGPAFPLPDFLWVGWNFLLSIFLMAWKAFCMPGLARNFSIFSASRVFLNLSGTLSSSSSSGAAGASFFSRISPMVVLPCLFLGQGFAHFSPFRAGFLSAAGAGLAPGFGAGLAPGLGAGLAPGLGAGLAPGLGAGFAPALGAGFVGGFGAALGAGASFLALTGAFLAGLASGFPAAFFSGAAFSKAFAARAAVSSSRLEECVLPFMPSFSSSAMISLLETPSSLASSYILFLAILSALFPPERDL